MNSTLILAFWRERFTSPVRLLLLIMIWSFSLLLAFLHRPVEIPDWERTVWFTLIIGAGAIGRDLSTGVLQLVLARPVWRTSYVLSRWVALGTAAFAIALASWTITLPFSLAGGGISVPKAMGLLLDHLLMASGLAAVITGFSALVAGFGDLALWLVGLMISSGFAAFGRFAGHEWATRLAGEIFATLMPHFSVDKLAADGGFHYYPIVAWFSTVTLSLLLGVAAMNRRELSYATAG